MPRAVWTSVFFFIAVNVGLIALFAFLPRHVYLVDRRDVNAVRLLTDSLFLEDRLPFLLTLLLSIWRLARFTNLIAEPDASESAVVDAVNDTLKAIAASLLRSYGVAGGRNCCRKVNCSQLGAIYSSGRVARKSPRSTFKRCGTSKDEW